MLSTFNILEPVPNVRRLLIPIFTALLAIPNTVFAEDQGESDTEPRCYTYKELMHDLRYGHCGQFQVTKGRRGSQDLCPGVSDLLNSTPQNVIADLISETSDPGPFSKALSCKFVPSFIRQGINRIRPNGTTLLHDYAAACDKDHVVLARILGAKEVRDRRGQTPGQRLAKAIDRLELGIRLENDSAKAAELQQSVAKCKDTLATLQKKSLSIEDLRPMSVPRESKITLVEYGKTHGTITDDANPAVAVTGSK